MKSKIERLLNSIILYFEFMVFTFNNFLGEKLEAIEKRRNDEI